MRKIQISRFAFAAALIVVAVAGSNTSTRVDAAVTGARIDPIGLTTSAGLQVEQYKDYSMVF